MPAPHDDNWNEDKTEFMVLTFEECLIYVAIDVRKGTQNTLKSAHNIHYLVILIILFLRYPQYNFTSGYAVPRGEPAHTDPIFTEMGGASEEEHSHGSNKGSGDGVSAQSLSDAQRKARDKIIWLLAKLEGRGGGGE